MSLLLKNEDVIASVDWKSALDQHQNLLVYQTPQYLSLLCAVLQAECFWSAVADSCGKILAGVPFIKKTTNMGTVINSLPFFGSNGGVLNFTPHDFMANAAIRSYIDHSVTFENLLSATFIESPIQNESERLNVHASLGLATDQRISLFTDLTGVSSETELISKFEDPRPRNIRKARSLGVTVRRESCGEALDFLCEVHHENMSLIGGKTKPIDFFRSVPKFLESESWSVFIAYLNRQPIGGLLVLNSKHFAEYFIPAIKSEFRSTQALSLVILEAMLDCVSRGISKWNWGGTWKTQSGVYDFKRRWGVTESTYSYFTWFEKEGLKSMPFDELAKEYPYFYLYPKSEDSTK